MTPMVYLEKRTQKLKYWEFNPRNAWVKEKGNEWGKEGNAQEESIVGGPGYLTQLTIHSYKACQRCCWSFIISTDQSRKGKRIYLLAVSRNSHRLKQCVPDSKTSSKSGLIYQVSLGAASLCTALSVLVLTPVLHFHICLFKLSAFTYSCIYNLPCSRLWGYSVDIDTIH
jgi:hypothetical protein